MPKNAFFLTIACLILSCPAVAQQPTRSDVSSERTFTFGFEQRVRSENWNNIADFSDASDDEREQVRYRTRIWAALPVTSTLDLNVGLNQETNQKMGKINQFDEVIFDQFYLDFKRLPVKGLSLRIGRQNLQRGDGFLLIEGGPGDGSRTLYVNGIDLAYEFKKSKLEWIGILDPSRDRFLPRLHDQRKVFQNWDDQAFGFYYTDHNHARTSFETYYFYKKEVHDILPVANTQHQPDRHINTAGGRVVQKVSATVSLNGEISRQWGAQHGNLPISAWGGNAYLKKSFKNAWNPYVQVGYVGMSGSDPSDPSHIGNFDPIFSRWPGYSELYIYSLVKENGVAYWTNLSMPYAEAGFTPRKSLKARFSYYQMGSFHPFSGSRTMFGTGTTRGASFQTRLDFTLNQYLKGHVLAESQTPGDFYASRQRGYFIRGEMIYTLRVSATTAKLKHLVGVGQEASMNKGNGISASIR